ncbi:hypothetical protein ACLB2K_029568 [Fragaria x ananassa]
MIHLMPKGQGVRKWRTEAHEPIGKRKRTSEETVVVQILLGSHRRSGVEHGGVGTRLLLWFCNWGASRMMLKWR